MWENAAKHTDTPPAPPAAAEPGEYDTLLWAQIILCVLIAAGVFAARALELPLYSTLRTDYRYALAQPGPDFWNTDGSRNVVRFTQETFAELRGAAASHRPNAGNRRPHRHCPRPAAGQRRSISAGGYAPISSAGQTCC